VVNVTAYHPVETAATGLAGGRGFKPANILERIFYFSFKKSGKRPVFEADNPPNRIEGLVQVKGQRIGAVSQVGEPSRVGNDGVEAVAVNERSRLPSAVSCTASCQSSTPEMARPQ